MEQPKHKKANYVLVFVALTIITIAEVAVSYMPLPKVWVLVPMALLKALLVVMFYMHLRFDNRIFTILFSLGLFAGLGLLIPLLILLAPVVEGKVP